MHLNLPIPCFVNIQEGSLLDTVHLVQSSRTINPPTVHASSDAFNAMVKAPRNPTPARICNDAACFLLSILSQRFSVPSIILLQLLRLHPSLLLLLRLLQLLLPEIVRFVGVDIREDQVKDITIPVHSVALDVFLDILFTQIGQQPVYTNQVGNFKNSPQAIHTNPPNYPAETVSSSPPPVALQPSSPSTLRSATPSPSP
jgi:hypothetical protein